MVKKKCIFCNKPIKDFKVWEDTTTRKTHRSCWLGFREFEYRHFDFLFSKDRKIALVALLKLEDSIKYSTFFGEKFDYTWICYLELK